MDHPFSFGSPGHARKGCTSMKKHCPRWCDAPFPLCLLFGVLIHPIGMNNAASAADAAAAANVAPKFNANFQPKGMDWCQTQSRQARLRAQARNGFFQPAAGCPLEGAPDIPANRDRCIPDENTPIKFIRLKVNVFAKGDGTMPWATQEEVDGQMATLNADFLPWRIQFVYETA